jgi:hypothetical protein
MDWGTEVRARFIEAVTRAEPPERVIEELTDSQSMSEAFCVLHRSAHTHRYTAALRDAADGDDEWAQWLDENLATA